MSKSGLYLNLTGKIFLGSLVLYLVSRLFGQEPEYDEQGIGCGCASMMVLAFMMFIVIWFIW